MYWWNESLQMKLEILYLKINCLVADISVAFLCCWEWLIWVYQAAEHLTKNWYDCRLCTFNQCFKLPLFLGECRSSMWNAQVNQNLLAVPTFFHVIDKVYSYWMIILVNNIWYQFMKVFRIIWGCIIVNDSYVEHAML